MDDGIPSDAEKVASDMQEKRNIANLDLARQLRATEEARAARNHGQFVGGGNALAGMAAQTGVLNTDPRNIRWDALNLAIRMHPNVGSDEIVKAAERYYDFITKP